MFDTCSICDTDLLRKLGLEVFKDTPNHKEHEIGKVTFDDGSFVKVSVCPMPTQFFRAEIYCAQGGKKYRIKTGSEDFQTHWPMFKSLAEDMLVIDSEIISIE